MKIIDESCGLQFLTACSTLNFHIYVYEQVLFRQMRTIFLQVRSFRRSSRQVREYTSERFREEGRYA